MENPCTLARSQHCVYIVLFTCNFVSLRRSIVEKGEFLIFMSNVRLHARAVQKCNVISADGVRFFPEITTRTKLSSDNEVLNSSE